MGGVRKGGSNMKDCVSLVYVKDGKIYPVGMTLEQHELLQRLVKVFEPLHVLTKYPMGDAVNIIERMAENESTN